MDTRNSEEYRQWVEYLNELLWCGAGEPRMREWEDLA